MAPLPSRTIASGELLQHVSRVRYRDAALHFGRTGANRYDAPDKSFGVLYLAFDLDTALMESVFHQHAWHTAPRFITLAEVRQRLVRLVPVQEDLVLLDLFAPKLMAARFGLNLEELSSRDYVHTQEVSHAVHGELDDGGGPAFDGLLYPSRNNFPAPCVALFERAGTKLAPPRDVDLVRHRDWPAFVSGYRIAVGGQDAPSP